ncbi:hypothetical protein [Kribbella endophytica]
MAGRDQLDCVAGADLGGMAVGLEGREQLQTVGLQAVELRLHAVESGQHFAATHRPHWALPELFHADHSAIGRRLFLGLEALVHKGSDDWPDPAKSGVAVENLGAVRRAVSYDRRHGER